MSNKNLDDKNYLKRFENGFKILTYSRSPYEVWSDIIEIFAITIQNSCTRHYNENDKLKSVWQNRENQYLKKNTKYSPNTYINTYFKRKFNIKYLKCDDAAP